MKNNLIPSLALVLTLAGTLLAGPYTEPGIPGVMAGGTVNPIFVAWASECVDYSPTSNVGPSWDDPDKALGPVTGDKVDIVSLGDLLQSEIGNTAPGEITLGFEVSICNGTGTDFAVFENSFVSGGGVFAELAYVQVSTDGETFVQFPCVSLTEDLVGNYGTIDPTDVYNLAGKHLNAYGESYGMPFDLEELAADPLVLNGTVDLNDINYVKLVDIPGSGDFLDSTGTLTIPANPIYDAWPTYDSGGLDLEAVGVIHAVPEPSAILLLTGLAAAAVYLRRRR